MMRLHCDGCDVVGDATAKWLTLGRRGSAFSLFDHADPDPVLGSSGLSFHSYDCLRIWLMSKAEVTS